MAFAKYPNTKMKNLFGLFLFLISVVTNAQYLSHAQIKADLEQLQDGIKKYNPALHLHNPHFERHSDELIAGLKGDSLSLVEAFKYVSQLCALSNEGHFALGNWKDSVHAGFLKNEYHYLPLSIRIRQGKMYVWHDNSNEQRLTRGNEILTINGLEAKSILELIRSCTPSDGTIKTYSNQSIELGFSWMYYLYVSQAGTFKITVKNNLGQEVETTVTALLRDAQFANHKKMAAPTTKAKEDVFYTLKHQADISYLTLPSFSAAKIEKHGIKSRALYKSIFMELQQRDTKYLVIDLRGNTGGRNELADDIVPFIHTGLYQAPFLKKTVSWEGKEKVYKSPKPSKLAFTGKIYVLVNGRTYSAGSMLARYLKEYNGAIIIGEETGTRYEGFAAGSKQYITLANSQLEIGIPRYRFAFPTSNFQLTSNQGLLPQHTVEYTMNHSMQNVDLHLDKVNELIHSHKQSLLKK